MNTVIQEYSKGVDLLKLKSKLYALECDIEIYKINIIGTFTLWGSPFFYDVTRLKRQIKQLSK